MNIAFQPQQSSPPTATNQSEFYNQLSAQNTLVGSNTSSKVEGKTVFESILGLGKTYLEKGKLKTKDYAKAAFDIGKNYLENSTWLKNSNNVFSKAINAGLQSDTWQGALSNAGAVFMDWGKGYLSNLIGKWF